MKFEIRYSRTGNQKQALECIGSPRKCESEKYGFDDSYLMLRRVRLALAIRIASVGNGGWTPPCPKAASPQCHVCPKAVSIRTLYICDARNESNSNPSSEPISTPYRAALGNEPDIFDKYSRGLRMVLRAVCFDEWVLCRFVSAKWVRVT